MEPSAGDMNSNQTLIGAKSLHDMNSVYTRRSCKMMGFSEEIRRARQRCLLTQTDFAKKVNVTFSTVNRWESGKAKPGLAAMKSIKEFCLKNDVDYSSIEEAWLDFSSGR